MHLLEAKSADASASESDVNDDDAEVGARDVF